MSGTGWDPSRFLGGLSAARRSTGWANTAAVSLGVMAVLCAGVFAHAGFVENIGGPVMLFGLLLFLAVIPVAFDLRYGVLGWLGKEHSVH